LVTVQCLFLICDEADSLCFTALILILVLVFCFAMENRWNDQEAQAAINKYSDVSEDIALRVYTSRLIGSNPALVIHGGGNTSVKSVVKNRIGEETKVLYVKGSGWDLDTIEPPGLPGVKLDYILKLRELEALSDEDMVNDQRVNLLDAKSPNPSVETLLHAFLPHKFIDHSHADEILVLANQPNAVELCQEIYGDFLGIVPYIMPGFLLAKAAAEAYEKNPSVKGLVLINHGLFTFGETAKESYDYHIEAVTRAEEYIKKHDLKTYSPQQILPTLKTSEILGKIGPVIRGLYHEHTQASWTLHYRENPDALSFANSEECSTWSQIGTITPDHVIRTKQKPLLLNPKSLNDDEALRKEISQALDDYIENYHCYFKTNKEKKGVDKTELDPLPRVALIAGVGLVTIGKTVKETRVAADVYERSFQVVRKAFSVGKFDPLKDDDLFDMEYWSLEQAKLGKSVPLKLQGKVVLISGAASGIGLGTARFFAQNGANLFLLDRDGDKLSAASEQLKKVSKGHTTIQTLDITDENALDESFSTLLNTYGGLDILISNAGNAVQGSIGHVDPKALRSSFELNFFAHQALASRAVKIFIAQKTGGVLLFNASKAAFNPGKDFGPYALPKAAVVALTKQYALDYGSDNIRSNAVNADRVRTGMFSEEFIKERAAARNLEPDDYFKNNLLSQEVYDRDVAEGFLHLALAEKTTGSVLTIDGGNIAASPR
jgi:rhamnose utilization protein RhaD (predicted bifunctional aldolase and dehydrogenase)/NAD(P)-dependent dehydrogenase (short-subunit alcohol dehydrogenase family)